MGYSINLQRENGRINKFIVPSSAIDCWQSLMLPLTKVLTALCILPVPRVPEQRLHLRHGELQKLRRATADELRRDIKCVTTADGPANFLDKWRTQSVEPAADLGRQEWPSVFNEGWSRLRELESQVRQEDEQPGRTEGECR